MPQHSTATVAPLRLEKETAQPEAFGDGKLWIGQHSADQDILIFDPAEADPRTEVLSLYSLTQHRMRRFPRATVLERIHPLTDDLAQARAKNEYVQRATLRVTHEEAREVAHSEFKDRQRDGVIATHRRFVEALGLTYQGVCETDTVTARGTGRAQKCHACGIALDDFTGVRCGICSGMLCSCGSCSCGKRALRQ